MAVATGFINADMTFSASLKAHRARLGLKQSEMAAILGVSHRTWSTWETEESVPHLITQEGALARLAVVKPPR